MFNKRERDDVEGQKQWPVLQRRKIEKLKDERMREFERACGENFEWLENYYQGCVFAAIQNKQYTDHNGLNLSTASYPDEFKLDQQDQHSLEEAENTAPQDYSGNNMRTPTNSKTRTRSTHTYAGRGVLTESINHSHNRHPRSKQHSGQFLLKSPKTPILSSPMRTPRSPYERRRITPKRRRLRVDASAATRKAQRALRALRKRSESYPDSIDGSRRTESRTEQRYSKSDAESWQGESPEQDNEMCTNNSISTRQVIDQVEQRYPTELHNEDLAHATPEPVSSDPTFNADVIHKTPAKATQSRVRPSARVSAADHRSRRIDDMEMEVVAERKTTPGSRARDSMTLISPQTRSGSSKEQVNYLSSTPDLTRGSSAISLTTRGAADMDIDYQDIEINEVNYKRPRSSPFQDSIAPVRFGSPEVDADSRLAKSTATNKEAPRESRGSGFSRNALSLEDEDWHRDIVENSLLRRSTAKDPSRRPSAHQSSTTPKHPPEAEFRSLRADTSVVSRSDSNQHASTANGKDHMLLDRDHSKHRSIQDGPLYKNKNTSSSHVEPDFESAGPRGDDAHSTRHTGFKHSLSRSESAKLDDSQFSKRMELPEKPDAVSKGNSGNPGERGRPTKFGATEQRDVPLTTNNTQVQEVSTCADSVVARSRVATALPEKRTIGTRKPAAYPSNTQLHQQQQQQQQSNKMPPSRLTKMTMSSAHAITSGAGAQGASLSNHLQSQSNTSTSVKLSRAAQQQTGPGMDTPHSSTVPSGSASVTSNLLRQGLPRAPLPSARVKEGGLVRPEGQGTIAARKPLLTVKSSLTAKKHARPVLPTDSTLTTKSLTATLSGLSAANARDRDMRRDNGQSDLKRPHQQRELTPDLASAASIQESKVSTTTTTMSKKASSSSILMASLNKVRKEAQGQGQMKTAESSTSLAEPSQNPFLVPAPIHPPSAPAIAKHHEKTILPDIGSDGEDDDLPMSAKPGSDKGKLPAWASWEELERAMREQSHLNPQDIFGPIPALDMAEIFPGRELRFRPRTSTSHWGTADRLTAQEVVKYNEDMGWSSSTFNS
ncbi:hypothetical protein BGX28_000632 [Mortierella sp. GBA30]|nr:hypothetical protein BGX28_000632 [Mortierella sp. GBA30]